MRQPTHTAIGNTTLDLYMFMAWGVDIAWGCDVGLAGDLLREAVCCSYDLHLPKKVNPSNLPVMSLPPAVRVPCPLLLPLANPPLAVAQ